MPGLVTMLVFAGLSATAFSQNTPRIGRIIIVGNADTPDRVILERLGLFPGAPLVSAEVRAAEQRLRRGRAVPEKGFPSSCFRLE